MFSDDEKEILFDLLCDENLELSMSILDIKFYGNFVNSEDFLSNELDFFLKRKEKIDKILKKLGFFEEV